LETGLEGDFLRLMTAPPFDTFIVQEASGEDNAGRPCHMVATPEDFQRLVEQLRGEGHIAVDTESNGFYAYFERVCVIQLSIASQDFVLDVLALDDLKPLGALLADPGIEKIFHAAANDIGSLKRDFDFQFANVFDTAIACKLLGHRRLGLAATLEREFGVRLDKKCQRCDWGRRPLTEEQVVYACQDTRYLVPLRHRLAERLEKEGLIEKAAEAFEAVCRQSAPRGRFPPNGYLKIRGFKTLGAEGRRAARELYQLRDQVARSADKAPFRVMTNDVIFRLARNRPQNLNELARIKGLPRHFKKGRLAEKILHAVQ
jgi:ribonuclease D